MADTGLDVVIFQVILQKDGTFVSLKTEGEYTY